MAFLLTITFFSTTSCKIRGRDMPFPPPVNPQPSSKSKPYCRPNGNVRWKTSAREETSSLPSARPNSAPHSRPPSRATSPPAAHRSVSSAASFTADKLLEELANLPPSSAQEVASMIGKHWSGNDVISAAWQRSSMATKCKEKEAAEMSAADTKLQLWISSRGRSCSL